MFALYSLTTGIIQTIVYRVPTNKGQLAALTAAGYNFVEVPEGINPQNSIIDMDTGAAMPTGPVRKEYHRYQYNETGLIHSTVHSWLPDGHEDLSLANQIVSPPGGPIPELAPGMILQLDAHGLPAKDQDGKHIAEFPEPIIPPPEKSDLILVGMVNAGFLTADVIPDSVLERTNASLAVANIPAIEKGKP